MQQLCAISDNADVLLHVAAAAPATGEAAGQDEEEETTCHACGHAELGDVLLLCDGCDATCHLQCCRPALKRVPKGDWFCVNCTAARAQAAPQAGPNKVAARLSGKRRQQEAALVNESHAPAEPQVSKRARYAQELRC